MSPRAGLECADKLAHARIRSKDRPALSESVYRLRYRGPFVKDTYRGERDVVSFAAYRGPGDYQ